MSERLDTADLRRLSLEEMRAEAVRRRQLGNLACGSCALMSICAKKETSEAIDCEGDGGRNEPTQEELLDRYRRELDDKSKNLVMAQVRRYEDALKRPLRT